MLSELLPPNMCRSQPTRSSRSSSPLPVVVTSHHHPSFPVNGDEPLLHTRSLLFPSYEPVFLTSLQPCVAHEEANPATAASSMLVPGFRASSKLLIWGTALQAAQAQPVQLRRRWLGIGSRIRRNRNGVIRGNRLLSIWREKILIGDTLQYRWCRLSLTRTKR